VRTEAIWLEVIGVGLILIGLTLLASPEIFYTTREKLGDTRYSVKREKTLVVPRGAAVLLIGAGAAVFAIAIRRSHRAGQ
jgi:hypothetical protein